jgi:NitT/TauT family transport system permease protein
MSGPARAGASPARSRAERRRRLRIARQLMPWFLTVLFLTGWQALSQGLHIATFMLPAPTDIIASLLRYHQVIASNAWQTLVTTGIGFVAAVVFGLLGGLAIGASAFVYSGVYPLLVAFNAVPKVALVPVFVLWFGIGAVPAVLTAFALSFFPIVVNVATGLATIEPEMEDLMRSLGATRWEILTKIGLPRAMPYLFASLKVSVTLAFVGSVISETVASNDGIGFLMLAASSRFDVPLVFAGLTVIALMAVVAYVLCGLAETRLTFWAFRSRRD